MNDLLDRIRAGQTLAHIAREMGVSRQRVHQIASSLDGYAEAKAHASTARSGRMRDLVAAQRDARRDDVCLRRHGITRSNRDELKAIGATKAYREQKNNAVARGIAWEFTLKDWWAVWSLSGRWEERGCGHGYVMARHGDIGPYAPWNVYICTQRQNMQDSYVFKPAHTRNRPIASLQRM